MNNEQYKRYRKMEHDKLSCLFKAKDKSGNLHFLILGSTDTKYKVSIYMKDRKIRCSCPDFKNNSSSRDCVCKHCLHVLYKVLKLFKNADHSFFEKFIFNENEIAKIMHVCKIS